MQPDPNTGAPQNLSSSRESRPHVIERVELFEKRQQELWRLTFFVLFLVSVVFAWMSWDWLRAAKLHLEALPIGLVVLVTLLGVYVWKKTQEIAELKGLVRGLDKKDAVLPSDNQLQHLFSMISKSQQGFRDLIDSFDDILLAMDLEGEIRAVNRSFSDLVGKPFQEIIGCRLGEFFEDVDGNPIEVLEAGKSRFLERRIWSGVVQVRLKKRNSVYFFDCVAHAMIRDDEVHGVTVLARDITAMKRSEARFTELFETLQEGIYIVSPEDKILEVNPALVRMLGYSSKEELMSKRVSEVFVDEAQRASIVREVSREASPHGHELTLHRKDGQPVYCLNTASAVRDTAGNVIRFQGALVDITERRAIEKQLHQQQEFARRLVDSFPDLIFVVDTDRRYNFVSAKFKEVLGYEPAEVIGLTFGERTHVDDRPAMMALFDDLVSGKQNFASIEVRVRHKQGEWRSLKCNFSPLFDEHGKIEGAVVSGRDVTEVKRLETQLIQAEKLAAMGQMLAGVAHELNNPLTAILGASELLRERQGVDENTKRQLEMTHRQARRAARIVQNLLEFSWPASPQKKTLDLNVVIDRTLQLQDHSLRRNNVEVEFQAVPGFPLIVGDANQLIQIFLNLISNAEQAIREARPSGRIQIRLGRSGNRVSATVQDDGIGIPPEVLPKLFDPFFTTKRPGGGTGLGLSICMSIVREHGGNIEASSLPAGGAAFTVTLPVAEPEAGRRTPAKIDSGSGERAMPTLDAFSKHSVLVLDDEESIRMLLTEGLAAYGLKVDCAATAEQAMSLVLNTKYDVILCDLKLSGSGPNADGYGVAQRLKIAAAANQPEIIFMSGDLMSEENSDLPPAARRLQKPFRVSDVLHALTEIFSPSPVQSTRQ
ncbi:MAG TPA: PAS domain S-box protein [Candidatus Acidoferrales bacterium]|nr:PAS domain S-box protein [Candidatus Acidoferrales bacterium]